MSFKRYGDAVRVENYNFGDNSVEVKCPNCQNNVGIKDDKYIKLFEKIYPLKELIGIKIICKKCGRTFIIE